MDLEIQKRIGSNLMKIEIIAELIKAKTREFGLIWFQSSEYELIYYELRDYELENEQYTKLQEFLDKSWN